MNVIFLDIDGVLVTARSTLARGGDEPFDREACAILAQVCELAPAQVVVSSTWREGESRERFAVRFERHGLPKDALHEDWATPALRGDRQPEIDDWLSRHSEVTEWAVIDDGIGLDECLPRLVRTEFDEGLGFRHALHLCAIFSVDAETWCSRMGVRFTGSDRAFMDSVAAELARDR